MLPRLLLQWSPGWFDDSITSLLRLLCWPRNEGCHCGDGGVSREHLSQEDLRKNKAMLEGLTKGQMIDNPEVCAVQTQRSVDAK